MTVEMLLSLLVGVMVAASVFLMLRRSLMRYVFGLILLSNAVNLAIFTAGGLTRGKPPLVPDGVEAPLEEVANAVPQALILTAIVISFGLLAFALVLVFRASHSLGTVDSDAMGAAERRHGKSEEVA